MPESDCRRVRRLPLARTTKTLDAQRALQEYEFNMTRKQRVEVCAPHVAERTQARSLSARGPPRCEICV